MNLPWQTTFPFMEELAPIPIPRRPYELVPRRRLPRVDECNCPVCGAIMPRRQISVDLEWNRVAFDGELLDLTAIEAEFVFVLEQSRGKLVTLEMLRQRVFASDDVGDSRIYTYMGRVNQKLRRIGLHARIHPGFGWRLEILPQSALRSVG
jgi:DNA-binding response OmpR family regulator